MAREFDGSTDRIDYSPFVDLNASAISVSMQVWWDNFTDSASSYLMAYADAGGTQSLICWKTSGNALRISRFKTTSAEMARIERSGAGLPSSGVWTSVIWMLEAGATITNGNIFVNGAEPAGGSDFASAGTENDYTTHAVGGKPDDNTRNHNGRIANVGIWNRLLTADEIHTLGFHETSPLALRNGLVHFSPLVRSVNDAYGAVGTLDGTTVIEHPRTVNARGSQ